MTFLFDALFLMFMAVSSPLYVFRGKHRHGWAERWGRVPRTVSEFLEGRKSVYWIHGVSVGEVRLACHLAGEIRKRRPQAGILITVSTASGRRVAEKICPDGAKLTFFPWDLSWVVRRYLRSIRPTAVIFVETEIWPNLLTELAIQKVPAYIVNGRISDKAFDRYRWVRRWFWPAMKAVKVCLAQSDHHGRRFAQLGVPEERIRVTGNMKFDLLSVASDGPYRDWVDRGKKAGSLNVWLCASTHPGEESGLLDVYLKLKEDFPHLSLVLAPRHVERVLDVERLLRGRNVPSRRLTSCPDESEAFQGREVVLVDVWGALQQLYAVSDIVFIGGSLVPHGGHNMAEPAVFEKAICYGPHMGNFEDMAGVFEHEEACLRVDGVEALESVVRRLILDPDHRNALGQRAWNVLMRNRGATERNADEILESAGHIEASPEASRSCGSSTVF